MSVGKETWGRLSPLLDELLDLPDDERDARLAALRAQDPALAEAVAAMLQHLPAIERGEFMPASALPKPAGLAGQAIGPYTLVREIGHGGMGTVWLARRTDGRYEGEVAIKFLRSGLFGPRRRGALRARGQHPRAPVAPAHRAPARRRRHGRRRAALPGARIHRRRADRRVLPAPRAARRRAPGA